MKEKQVLGILRAISHSRIFWVVVLIVGVALESTGLYFQYSENMDPCVYCVYERALIATYVVAGFVGFIAPDFLITRVLAVLIALAGSVWGLYISISHYLEVYSQDLSSQCQLSASFPSFLPLDEWLPWLFSPTGACMELPWRLLGYGMPEWIIAIFSVGLILSALLFITEFVKVHRSYGRYYR